MQFPEFVSLGLSASSSLSLCSLTLSPVRALLIWPANLSGELNLKGRGRGRQSKTPTQQRLRSRPTLIAAYVATEIALVVQTFTSPPPVAVSERGSHIGVGNKKQLCGGSGVDGFSVCDYCTGDRFKGLVVTTGRPRLIDRVR